MSLLTQCWIPVRHRDGSREWITPHQLSDLNIVAFDADRPDFNGALAQFAIGLLQTTTPVDTDTEWSDFFEMPPDAVTLQKWFDPVREAFNLDGAKARFMQDFILTAEEGGECDIASLLIESPGENALEKNGDHFIKRDAVKAVCSYCAAMALLTLQINAPAGGKGNRTGLRGGGPLTTLVKSGKPKSLWHDLWLNVQPKTTFLANCDSTKTQTYFTFPWLAPIEAIQKGDREKSETAPSQVHPAHVFWAMPRRIRLDFDHVSKGECDICGQMSENLVSRYITKNYGFNYKGVWRHPFSPYYQTKEESLPLHPQPGGIGHQHWLGLVLGVDSTKKKQKQAAVLGSAFSLVSLFPSSKRVPLSLWSFGYDMDNMKARCWYESTLPLYNLAECSQRARKDYLEPEIKKWLEASDEAAFYLKRAVKDAWFSVDAKGDFSMIDAMFWSETEPAFYKQLEQWINTLVKQEDNIERLQQPMREQWLKVLQTTSLRLFNEVFVGAGLIERQNPRRIAEAYRNLKKNKKGEGVYGPRIRDAIGLPPLESDKAKSSKKIEKAAA